MPGSGPSANPGDSLAGKDHELQIRYRTLSIHVDTMTDEKKAAVASAKGNDPAASIRQIDVHRIPVDEVYTRFSTSPTVGLEASAIQRRAKDGKNVISPPPTQWVKKSLNYVFGGFNFLMWIAFIVTVLSYKPLGQPPAIFNLGVAFLLLLVIIVSSTFYALVDWHASRIMNSIKTLIADEASVIRDGQHQSIPARDLVVGDVVTLTMGDRVPADLRLVQISSDVRFDRSLLTGERKLHWVVFAVGDKSVMGRIVAMSGATKFKLTTVQKEVWFFTKIISTLALGLFALSLIVWAGWVRKAYPGYATASSAIINSIGCLTAFVPQGLPVCVALSLTIVARRMAKRNVLVKNLATIETLGCMSVLCSDKTGTLTVGKMERQVKGDATDTAVLRFSEPSPSLARRRTNKLSIVREVIRDPFNSRNKWMLSVVAARPGFTSDDGVGRWMLVKGGPDVLFPKCSMHRATLQHLQERWSSEGQRVLALCRPHLVGLVGIRDPPRTDVPDAVRIIRRAGVRVFMVTGDFKLTALAIARQVGIITEGKVDDVQSMRKSEVARRYAGVRAPACRPGEDDGQRALVLTGDDIVFARTTPEQKLRIVEETKARGDNTVAVTGDGVNDAPALKAADIGVAMGSGSDVAKEAASMILLNNDLMSVTVAIEMGRLVFDNLKKVIVYLMPAGTYTEFVGVFANVCFSITNDVVMSISLMYEKPESDLMLRKPRNARTDRLTNWQFFFHIYLFIGLMMWPCAMGMWFLWMKQNGLGFYDVFFVFNKWQDGYKGFTIDELNHLVAVGQCIYYVTMVFMQYGGLLAVRNRRVSILRSNPLWGPRRNLVVLCGMLGTLLIAVVNLYGPGLQNVFGTTPIPGMFWGIPFAFAAGILLVDEVRKLIVRTYPKSIVAKAAW
ncbi:calcium ATPase transmembrane domain M-containing protein [Epithele typhae]|uniref:calcium ATPase transmembrane domain M-containing protein n=1 Tax=Epithele typhae TaxID=378194 RepID=UPI002007B435|nr:calcium ATPase transmembrane domain M-containing protein [Epithele typhae]KAH9930428.1 calcium ATPase transmembrane domain M-containing protein [Epithele typhae]